MSDEFKSIAPTCSSAWGSSRGASSRRGASSMGGASSRCASSRRGSRRDIESQSAWGDSGEEGGCCSPCIIITVVVSIIAGAIGIWLAIKYCGSTGGAGDGGSHQTGANGKIAGYKVSSLGDIHGSKRSNKKMLGFYSEQTKLTKKVDLLWKNWIGDFAKLIHEKEDDKKITPEDAIKKMGHGPKSDLNEWLPKGTKFYKNEKDCLMLCIMMHSEDDPDLSEDTWLIVDLQTTLSDVIQKGCKDTDLPFYHAKFKPRKAPKLVHGAAWDKAVEADKKKDQHDREIFWPNKCEYTADVKKKGWLK